MQAASIAAFGPLNYVRLVRVVASRERIQLRPIERSVSTLLSQCFLPESR
jgi:hypothetical protein